MWLVGVVSRRWVWLVGGIYRYVTDLSFIMFYIIEIPSLGGGIPSIDDVQEKAVSLSTYTSVAPQWTLFPFMSFSCNCSITGWTFIAAGPINSSGQNLHPLQFQLWTPTDHTNSSFSLLYTTSVGSGNVDILDKHGAKS